MGSWAKQSHNSGRERGQERIRHLPDRFFDFEEPLDDFLGFFIRWYFRASSLSGAAAFPGAGGCVLEGTIREAQVSSQKRELLKRGWKKTIQPTHRRTKSQVSAVVPWHLPLDCSWKGERPVESSGSGRPAADGNHSIEQPEDLRKGERDFNSEPHHISLKLGGGRSEKKAASMPKVVSNHHDQDL